jgi:NADH:ubiquinone oxidoreductase subunit H
MYDTDYIFVLAILFILFSFSIILIGFFSRNKYGLIAAIGGSVLVISLDAVMGILVLNTAVIYYSFCLTVFFVSQDRSLLFLGFLIIFCLIIIIP